MEADLHAIVRPLLLTFPGHLSRSRFTAPQIRSGQPLSDAHFQVRTLTPVAPSAVL